MSRLLTVREIAEMISVSTETVLRWTRRGELPAIKLPGGAIRFREDEIDTWLAARATVVDTGRNTNAAPRGAVTPTEGLTTGDATSHG